MLPTAGSPRFTLLERRRMDLTAPTSTTAWYAGAGGRSYPLDKGHVWPRTPNPDGTFMGAMRASAQDQKHYWNAEDVARRMDFSLRCAFAHGTVAIRTHLNSAPPLHDITWPVFNDMRERWAGRIALQAVCLISLEKLAEPLATELADLVADLNGVFGVVAYASPTLEPDLRRVFGLARERGLDLDFHADESLDAASQSLDLIADLAIEFPGKVHAGHCCSLSVQPDDLAASTLKKLRAAGVSISSQPMCNLYLQDRQPRRTPRLRGVTLLHEMRARGIPVALASDNSRDPFYGYGDLDLLEVFTQAVRIAHLDRPIGDWPAAVSRTPARIMGLEAGVIRAGAAADLIICEGRTFDEVLSRRRASASSCAAVNPSTPRHPTTGNWTIFSEPCPQPRTVVLVRQIRDRAAQGIRTAALRGRERHAGGVEAAW